MTSIVLIRPRSARDRPAQERRRYPVDVEEHRRRPSEQLPATRPVTRVDAAVGAGDGDGAAQARGCAARCGEGTCSRASPPVEIGEAGSEAEERGRVERARVKADEVVDREAGELGDNGAGRGRRRSPGSRTSPARVHDPRRRWPRPRPRPGPWADRRSRWRARCRVPGRRRRGPGSAARSPAGDPRRCGGVGHLDQDGAVAGRTQHELAHANGASSNPAALQLTGDPGCEAHRARRVAVDADRARRAALGDRRRLARRLVLFEQVAGRAARDERAVGQIAAVGERLGDGAQPGCLGVREQRRARQAENGSDAARALCACHDRSSALLVDGCPVVERAVRLHVGHRCTFRLAQALQRRDLLGGLVLDHARARSSSGRRPNPSRSR